MGFIASRTSIVGDIVVILVILVVRQMVAAAKWDGREAFLPMVAAAKFVVAMAHNTADSSRAKLS